MAAEQGTVEIDGKKLNKVEAIKLAKDGADVWDGLFRYARAEVPALDETKTAAFLASGGTKEDLPAAARHAASGSMLKS